MMDLSNKSFLWRRLQQMTPMGGKIVWRYQANAPEYVLSTVKLGGERFTRIERTNGQIVGHLTGDDMDINDACKTAHALDHEFEEGWVA